MNKLNFVCFCHVEFKDVIHHVADSLDLQVFHSLPATLPAVLAEPGNDVNVCVFEDPHTLQTDERARCLKDSHFATKLAIFTRPFETDVLNVDEYFDDFLVVPFTAGELELRIRRCSSPKEEAFCEDQQLLAEFSCLSLVGRSQGFVETLRQIKQIAPFDAPVLITGETGTGKENIARSIHALSARRDRPFVPINCGAIPDSLFESELFGHEKGTFTDAKTRQAGLIEVAQGGTLLLDEVNSLSAKAQVALLRYLQTQEYRPLGARQLRTSDVRILAATNANLKEWIAKYKFRDDLFYRINVLSIDSAPLRERRSDIPLIAKALLDKFGQQYQCSGKHLSHRAIVWLQRQKWPGNVRELENFLLREFLMTKGNNINISGSSSDRPACSNGAKRPESFRDAKASVIAEFERSYLEELLALTGGNVSKAARLALKERRTFGRLLKKYHLEGRN